MIFVISLFANLWIWYIFSTKPILGIFLLATTCFLYLSFNKRTFLLPFVISFICLSLFQVQTTSIEPLSKLSKQEELIQIQRMREYPPVFLSIAGKTLWIPVAYWLEARPETIVARHVIRNGVEVINPNLYFFANHPRERTGIREFEKFPYIFLPFFLFGLYRLFQNNKKEIALILGFSLLLFGVIGNNNPHGPFVFFPTIVSSISIGLVNAYKSVKSKSYSPYLIGIFSFVSIVIFIQVLSYATN